MYGGMRSSKLGSTELFLLSTGKTCPLQEGPARIQHTLDQQEDGQLIACGGQRAERSCHQFVPSLPYGTWIMSATLRSKRSSHTSLVSGGKVVLFGGWDGGRSRLNTVEVVRGGQSFNLQQITR